jgi:hypothetical protein
VVVFLRSWIFNQPTLSILHFVPWQSMCDAQCCQEMTPFTKNHLQKVKNIYYYLLIVPFQGFGAVRAHAASGLHAAVGGSGRGRFPLDASP